MEEIFYKDYETNLFAVKSCPNWHIAADSIEDALGLANKRSETRIEDLHQIGTSVTILGTSPDYDDVINMRDKLERAWELLKIEKSALNLACVTRSCSSCAFYFPNPIQTGRHDPSMCSSHRKLKHHNNDIKTHKCKDWLFYNYG